MSIKKSILVRVKIAYIFLLVIAALIVIQIINVQFVQGSQWRSRAEQIGLQYRIKKATRGNIYTHEGVMLATSVPLYQLSLDPTVVSDSIYARHIDSLSKLLSVFFDDRSPLDYLRKINDARRAKRRYIILNNRLISYTEKEKLSQWPIFREGQLKGGVLFEKAEDRTYPFGHLAARTIGYVNDAGRGVGIESSFNKYLAGVNGRALYQKIAGGAWKPLRTRSEIKPVDGYDVYTTLDVNIQDLVHQALEEALITHDANFGCAIVMEVKTGKIKAIANLGKVDNDEYRENYNYAIGPEGSSDPGSTFKIASMMALLEDTTLNLNDSIETGNGIYRYYDRLMRDTRPGGWGKITIQQAVELSSNIGVSKLISFHFGKNPDEYVRYMNQFGLTTSLTSLKLAGIARPYIKNTQDPTWSGVSLPWMSVGYELKASPLQMLTFFNAIANEGYLIEPMLIEKVSHTGQVIEQYAPKTSKNPICSPATMAKIKTMLEGVVERGTARNIQSKRYKIAGKTGTSQKLNERGRYIKKYKTSFVGYFPADHPKYTCIVVIDEPKGVDQYGAD
ncbi:MAG: penicillin-binding protein 2, partial [Bacteroidia bacterium]|nr:penicillin-binding protein 2 [Bacteroidia bacterium]